MKKKSFEMVGTELWTKEDTALAVLVISRKS